MQNRANTDFKNKMYFSLNTRPAFQILMELYNKHQLSACKLIDIYLSYVIVVHSFGLHQKDSWTACMNARTTDYDG